jgi:glycosyltransferase involved in cell wall biosynthesis
MAASTLNLTGQNLTKVPKHLQDKEPTFVMRYWMVSEIINQLLQGGPARHTILDVGGNGSLLPDMLKEQIDILDLPDNDYENYIQASALNMPIKDGAYEIVTACDVFEHIPEKDRSRFIEELIRVSSNYVILCGPMYKPESAAAEKRANTFFRDITGRDHPWLEEHISYTLPKEKMLLDILKTKGVSYEKFDHGTLVAWELLTKMNLMLIDRGVSENKQVVNKIQDLNEQYIVKNGLKDFADIGYRTVYIISKTGKAPKPILPKIDHGVTSATILQATEVLKQIVLSQSKHLADLDSTRATLNEQQQYNGAIIAELNAVHNSKVWFAFKAGRKLARPGVSVIRKTRAHVPIRRIKRTAGQAASRVPVVGRAMKRAKIEFQRHQISRQRRNEYNAWYHANRPHHADLESQREQARNFRSRPLISLVVPTYNTPDNFLKACIESVLAQTYDRWELCIADDASTDAKVLKTIENYAKKDSRIKYVFREKNGHICEASNSALALAKGDFVALLDHDDILWPNALYEVASLLNSKPKTDFVYTDEDKVDEKGTTHSDPFFKPAWSPEYLRSINYITHFSVIRRSLVDKVGGFRNGYEGAQDWDLFMRTSRETNRIEHIPKVLYSWRRSEGSTALRPSAKNYAYKNQRKVLIDDAKARGLKIKSLGWAVPQLIWETVYYAENQPLVSIIIPTKDQYTFIKKCLASLKKKTTYENFEVIIVDTGSTDKRVWKLYETYKKKIPKLTVVKWGDKFNFALVCNFGAKQSKGEYLLFLNNDTEVITPNWIELLLQYAQQAHVGAVGCKLLYPNKSLQHAGVVLGVGGNESTPGVAAHLFPAYSDRPVSDIAQQLYVGGTRNFSAVTAACVMVSRQKFNKIKGFDGEFQIAWNDVDFCLKLVKAGYYNVYTPQVKLYHHESISVGQPGSKSRDLDVFRKEIELFGKKWGWDYIYNDPYYSPHFRKDIANARLKPVD